jgi:hypothetical protein
MRTYLLWALGILLTGVGLANNPMLLILPMWIFTYLRRERLRRFIYNTPLSLSFIGFGMFFGFLTEIFAIVNNRHLPPEQRILLSPNPVLDLIYGVCADQIAGPEPADDHSAEPSVRYQSRETTLASARPTGRIATASIAMSRSSNCSR